MRAVYVNFSIWVKVMAIPFRDRHCAWAWSITAYQRSSPTIGLSEFAGPDSARVWLTVAAPELVLHEASRGVDGERL